MKIIDLHLHAFGPFTGKILEFSGGDFHLIFGPNEAGKSSALRAISSFLYGIPARSMDGFLHDNRALRIGGTLECADGRKQFFYRRKGNKDTLLDSDHAPCEDHEMAPFLGAVGEELFLHMFGLSHQRLIEGGREIVQGKGDAGKSIFAAGMGVSGLRKVLEKLSAKEEELFKPTGQKPEINLLLSTLVTAKQDLRKLLLPASAYAQAAKDLDNSKADQQELEREMGDLVNQITRLERIRQAAPKVARLKEVCQEREERSEAVLLPLGFSERRKLNQQEREKRLTAITDLKAEVVRLQKKIESLPVIDRIVELQSEIEETFKSENTYRKNRKDLPALKHKRHNLREEAQRLLKRLGLPDNLETIENLRLTHPQKTRITAATDELKSRQSDLLAVQKQLKKSEMEVEEIQTKLAGAPAFRPIDSLRGLLKLVSGEGDLGRQHEEVTAEAGRIEDSGQSALQRLSPPVTLRLDGLESLPAPLLETIKRFESEALKKQQGDALRDEKIRDVKETREKLLLKIDAVKKGEVVPTEEELLDKRGRRNHGWQLVRRAWEGERPSDDELAAFASDTSLADAYEQAVSKADATADELRRESGRVAQLTQLAMEQERLEKTLAEREKEQEACKIQKEAWLKEWRQVWAPAAIAPLSPAEMLSWYDSYRGLLELCRKFRELQAKQKDLENRIARWRARITEEREKADLASLNENITFAELIGLTAEAVELIQNENAERRQAERDLAKARDRLTRERDDLAALQKSEQEARKTWVETVAPLRLSANSVPEEAQVVLNGLGEIFQKLDEANLSVQPRVIGIEKECEGFETSVANLIERLGDRQSGSPQETINRLNLQLNDSLGNRTALNGFRQQIEEKEERITAAGRRLETLQAELRALLKEASVEAEEQLASIEETSERCRELAGREKDLREQLLEYCGDGTVNELVATVQEVDTETLPGQIQQLQARKQELAERLNGVNQKVWECNRRLSELNGSEAAALKAAEIQETVSALRTKVEEYARCRLASILLQREIERYRKEHQGPVLERAGQFFERLTLGSFNGLTTEFDDKDGQVLIGSRPDGSSVHVEGMSEGTCDQLYLALRLASLELHLKTNEPMPLILDDILVNFDDARSRATLEILSELSGKNQIIYFTHHHHILEMATALPPSSSISVHTLTDGKAREEDASCKAPP